EHDEPGHDNATNNAKDESQSKHEWEETPRSLLIIVVSKKPPTPVRQKIPDQSTAEILKWSNAEDRKRDLELAREKTGPKRNWQENMITPNQPVLRCVDFVPELASSPSDALLALSEWPVEPGLATFVIAAQASNICKDAIRSVVQYNFEVDVEPWLVHG
ncbi:3550_t:CDS:2, partial [Acaulospora colombiana]